MEEIDINDIWKEFFGITIGQCRNCWAKGCNIRFLLTKEPDGLWMIKCPKCGWTGHGHNATIEYWSGVFTLLSGNPPHWKEEVKKE